MLILVFEEFILLLYYSCLGGDEALTDKCKPKRCINHVVPILKGRTLVSGDRLTTAFRMSVCTAYQ